MAVGISRLAVTIAAGVALAACSSSGASPAMTSLDCGRQQQRQPAGGQVVECLSHAFANGRAAHGQIELFTIEGDPVPVTFQIRGRGTVEVTADWTRDRYGSKGVEHYRCNSEVWLHATDFARCPSAA